jgi:hypothetical protein
VNYSFFFTSHRLGSDSIRIYHVNQTGIAPSGVFHERIEGAVWDLTEDRSEGEGRPEVRNRREGSHSATESTAAEEMIPR